MKSTHKMRLPAHHVRQKYPRQQCCDHRGESSCHGAPMKLKHQRENNDVNDQAEPVALGQLPPYHGDTSEHDDPVNERAKIQVGKSNVHDVQIFIGSRHGMRIIPRTQQIS